MATCNETPVVATPKDIKLDVIAKYQALMKASVGPDSIYEQSKTTLLVLSEEFNLTEKERMDVVAGQITQMAVGISGSAMNTALAYAEKDIMAGYDATLKEAQASKTLTDAKVAAMQICLTEKEVDLKCAQITATLSGSFRDNGRPTAYESTDKCIPVGLKDEGLKFEQTMQVDASKYQILADAYRKSGVVAIAYDGDNQLKGVNGNLFGHTYSQTNIAERQVISFEDSKRNHACNASAQTIGQIISAEGTIDDALLQVYMDSLTYLTQNSPDVTPGGSEILDPVAFEFGNPESDTFNGAWQMTDQVQGGSHPMITTQIKLPDLTLYRAGDQIVFGNEGQGYSDSYTLQRCDLEQCAGMPAPSGLITMQIKSVLFWDGVGINPQTMTYQLATYVLDAGGNTSPKTRQTVTIQYIPGL